tara:strand:- start:439 stop:843 length:405 start_codon:yes stop_codon:yes gene_type:complete
MDENDNQAPSGVFISTISALKNGDVLDVLDDALREATQHCNETQKKTKVTLHLTVIPNGVGVDGETPVFLVDEEIKLTKPKKPGKPSAFFADEDMNLNRRMPKQTSLRLSVREGGAADKITAADLKAATGSSAK